MQTNRRHWLKQIGLGVAAVGFPGLELLAAPVQDTRLQINADQPIKLSSNENPYGPSALARKAMADSIGLSNRYHWQETTSLIEELAKHNQVTAEHILVGAGSTELLDLVARYAALQKGNCVIPDPSFTYWTSAAQQHGLPKIAVPLTTDKKIDLLAMQRAITSDTKLVYICNPNNPTGTLCDMNELKSFIREASKNCLVMLDEAYIDYTVQPSLANEVIDNKNLVVVKTFSKIYGLAGARVGYIMAHPSTLEKLAALQSWANGSISVVSAVGALASLKDRSFISDNYALNEQARKYTIEQLALLKLRCIPSHTNFIYFSLESFTKDYFALLKAADIQGTRIYEEQGKWTRITIGTLSEMKSFISVIQ